MSYASVPVTSAPDRPVATRLVDPLERPHITSHTGVSLIAPRPRRGLLFVAVSASLSAAVGLTMRDGGALRTRLVLGAVAVALLVASPSAIAVPPWRVRWPVRNGLPG